MDEKFFERRNENCIDTQEMAIDIISGAGAK